MNAPPLKVAPLKDRVQDELWAVADRHPAVLSATLAGSFVDSPGLEGVSDIDLILVVDRLDARTFDALVADFRDSLAPVLARAGYRLRINPTLGPLKFNEPDLAVLHLMLYSRQAHVEHVVQSPFTCLDWQRSAHVRKQTLAEVYPVFGLQPRHFVSARRSLQDYLRDFRASEVSYRELQCDEAGYTEVKRAKPMTSRDRHEFGYHVMRFLMRNLLKLVRRTQDVAAGDRLLDDYFAVFPAEREATSALLIELTAKKRALDFSEPVPNLDARLEAFLACFEGQFRELFFDTATRHVLFRHAPTAANRAPSGEVRFLGRLDAPILPFDLPEFATLADALEAAGVRRAVTSPLSRCRQTLESLSGRHALPPAEVCDALTEIDYGACDGLTVGEAQGAYPDLFAAWAEGGDPPFPGGESTADLAARVRGFLDGVLPTLAEPTAICTHNGVIRAVVGTALNVPPKLWYRLRVPHLTPVTLVSTRVGAFVDFAEAVEREVFGTFAA